jgi:MFS family permease
MVGKLTDRHGARPVVVVGVVLAALGTVLFAVAGPQTSEVLLGVSLVVRGAGLSAVTVAVMAAAFQGLAREQVPHASTATRIVLQVGASFGTAVLAVVLAQQLAGKSGVDVHRDRDRARPHAGREAAGAGRRVERR